MGTATVRYAKPAAASRAVSHYLRSKGSLRVERRMEWVSRRDIRANAARRSWRIVQQTSPCSDPVKQDAEHEEECLKEKASAISLSAAVAARDCAIREARRWKALWMASQNASVAADADWDFEVTDVFDNRSDMNSDPAQSGPGHLDSRRDSPPVAKEEIHSEAIRACRRPSTKALRGRLCALLQKCLQLQQGLLEADKKEKALAAAFEQMTDDVEALAEKLADAAQLAVPAETPDIHGGRCSDWAGRLQSLHRRIISFGAALLPWVDRSQKAKEELVRSLTCPLSHDILRRPMFAPDGQVYEERMIRSWLKEKPVSPFTQQPMRQCELLRARVVEQAAGALRHLLGPDTDDEATVAGKMDEEAVSGQEEHYQDCTLLQAIMARDEARALELLQEAGQAERLNDQLTGDGPADGATVLHHALLCGLPSVAVAIVQHPAFEMHRAKMGCQEGITAAHIAASLGFSDVCEALLQRCGGGFLADKVQHSAVFDLPGGDELLLQRGHHPLGMARLHHHEGTLTILRAGMNAFLNAARSRQVDPA